MILSDLLQSFEDCERTAWRFECQPTYAIPRENSGFALWKAGEPKPEGHNSAWHERVRGYLGAGKTLGRVRVVRRPPSADGLPAVSTRLGNPRQHRGGGRHPHPRHDRARPGLAEPGLLALR